MTPHTASTLLVVVVCTLHFPSGAARAQTALTTVRVASGLSRPVYVTAPPDDLDRLFIVEQHTGRIRILNLADGSINAAPFLDINGLATGNEQGLLGLAFDPDYAATGHFYVNLTVSGRTTHIRRYTVSGDPNVADPATSRTVLTYAQPQTNHNSGWIGFGPDGYLYIATGDGGGSDDNDGGHTAGTGNAQDITANLLGKMLRLDIDGDDFPADDARNYAIPSDNPFVDITGDDEIWAYGLRNPWRASFDRATGDLYIGDVGQRNREEIDFQPAASTGGENYGWRLREGFIATPTGGVGGARPPGAIDPIHDYPRSDGQVITGGYVYRGAAIPDLQGTYFFADYGTARIWSFRFDGTTRTAFTERTAELRPRGATIGQISSFGEDAAGNLYIVDLGGEVFRIVGVREGDFDVDGDVDLADYQTFLSCFSGSDGVIPRACCTGSGRGAPCDAPADFDGDDDVDLADLLRFQALFTGPQ